jgi:hypothetical protein
MLHIMLFLHIVCIILFIFFLSKYTKKYYFICFIITFISYNNNRLLSSFE